MSEGVARRKSAARCEFGGGRGGGDAGGQRRRRPRQLRAVPHGENDPGCTAQPRQRGVDAQSGARRGLRRSQAHAEHVGHRVPIGLSEALAAVRRAAVDRHRLGPLLARSGLLLHLRSLRCVSRPECHVCCFGVRVRGRPLLVDEWWLGPRGSPGEHVAAHYVPVDGCGASFARHRRGAPRLVLGEHLGDQTGRGGFSQRQARRLRHGLVETILPRSKREAVVRCTGTVS
mmetsp:Transcript_28911/g.82945  ORF Transcript_28911/g.82945 Transcript_28911/m.82945 type:complete len:230 (+) Transcript_28911:447-1136(+)